MLLTKEHASQQLRDKWSRKPSNKHLAGIIPVAAPPLEFNMPWHDSMMPIGPDYLAIERSVYECTMAGCNTIWIVCHMDMQPLLRKRIGDSICTNPQIETYTLAADGQQRTNIYYVPMHPKYISLRDSLSWSVVYGANTAYSMCRFMSKWIMPGKFYCSFPYGVMDIDVVRQNRNLIREEGKQFYFSHNGKTIKDGVHMSFTFDFSSYKNFRNTIKTYAFDKWNEEGRLTERPHQESRKFIKLEEAFKDLDFGKYSMIECPWFYDISTWDGYRQFIASGIKLEKDYRHFTMGERRKRVLHEGL